MMLLLCDVWFTVIADDTVQRSGGEALWSTVRYALQSRVVKALGAGIVCASAIALSRSQGGGGS